MLVRVLVACVRVAPFVARCARDGFLSFLLDVDYLLVTSHSKGAFTCAGGMRSRGALVALCARDGLLSLIEDADDPLVT